MLNGPNMALLYTWGEGLVIRYGREPTVLELLTDPILKIAKVRNVMHPEDLAAKPRRLCKASERT